jgi:hypothetical protein
VPRPPPWLQKSNSAASDVDLARFDLRIIRAMRPSRSRGKTAECVTMGSPNDGPADASLSAKYSPVSYRRERGSDRVDDDGRMLRVAIGRLVG